MDIIGMLKKILFFILAPFYIAAMGLLNFTQKWWEDLLG